MSLLTVDEIRLLTANPIPGDNPAGVNVRLEQAFESIEQEIAKLDSFTTDDPVRWGNVIATSRQILEEQSKDFLVACYLTRALCEADLLEGLQQGLTIAQGLVEQFWDHAFPPKKRMRGRSQAFEWLVEKCQPLLEAYQPRLQDLEPLKQLEQSLSALDGELLERMSEQAPNMAEFRQAFRRMLQGLEVEQGKKTAAVPTPAGAATQAAPTASASGSTSLAAASAAAPTRVGGDRDLMAVYRLCQDQLRNASLYLAARNGLDTEVFRINRFITWLGVNQLPPATQNKTQLRPVAKEKLDVISGLYQEQCWLDLVAELEPSLVKAPFWMSGQRMVCEALDELQAEGALNAVKQGVRDFVARLPGVVNLTFNDDTPFADEKTRQWLQQIQQSGPGPAMGAALTVDTSGISQDWEDAYQQATSLAQDKQLRDALSLFQDGVMRSTSLREQALWRFNQARFCVEQGLLELALPLLKTLDDQLTRQGVDEWEPQVSKRVLELLLRCHQQGEASEDGRRCIGMLHARLCKLDLALAFDLTTH